MKHFPIRSWERHNHRKFVPLDLQKTLGMSESLLRVGDHAWTNVQEPLPGAAVDSFGDALKGRGKHHSAMSYFDQLDEWLKRWEYVGEAPPGKGKQTEVSWEIYAPLQRNEWLLVVVSKRTDGEFYLKTVFPISNDKFSRRQKQGYLLRRGE